MEAFFGSTWNFHAIILLSENSVKLNSISDSLFDENVPIGVENKMLDRLQIFPKWEDYALTQLYCAPVSNNTVRGFFSTLVFWWILKKLTGFISQLLNVMTAGFFELSKFSSKWLSSISCRTLDSKKSVGILSGGFLKKVDWVFSTSDGFQPKMSPSISFSGT